MNFYTIYPSEHVNRDFSFYLKGNQDKVVDYFKFNDSSTGFLKNPRINMTYDNDFEGNLDEILNADFYYSASGILLFSKNFYEKLKDELASECDFFRCLVNNTEVDIYALYIKNTVNILDDDEKIIETKSIDSTFFLKDKSKPYIYMVTEKFVKLVEENKLEMQFLDFK